MSESDSSAVRRLQDILKTTPLDVDKLSAVAEQDSFIEELSHDETAWSALDVICDFLLTSDLEINNPASVFLCGMMHYLAGKANAREFILALSDRLARVNSDLSWSYLLKPLAISVNKLLSQRPVDATTEDAVYAALSRVIFMTRRFDETCDPGEVSDLCCRNVVTFVGEFVSEIHTGDKLGMYVVAASLTLAASPLSAVSPNDGLNNVTWKLAASKLCDVISHFSNPYAILADLTDIGHRYDRFLGQYFFNNNTGRWSHLHAGLACLLSANVSSFYLPQMLEPRFRFFLCANVIAALLTEITDTPNPDIDTAASKFQSMLACNLICNLLSSVPPDSFNSECITSVPSFTLLVRRLFLNLTNSPSSFMIDTESAAYIVKAIDEFMARLDFSGKWQLIWMWINQVPADSHPAGPVRAIVIDKFRALVAASLESDSDLLSEKLAKMLSMILTLTIARENVTDGQPGLVRVDATLAALNLLQYIFLLPKEKRLIDGQTHKTLAAWLEYELRPSVTATRVFLQGSAAPSPLETKATAKLNPWTYFSGQLLSRLDLVEFTLARVEQVQEVHLSKAK